MSFDAGSLTQASAVSTEVSTPACTAWVTAPAIALERRTGPSAVAASGCVEASTSASLAVKPSKPGSLARVWISLSKRVRSYTFTSESSPTSPDPTTTGASLVTGVLA